MASFIFGSFATLGVVNYLYDLKKKKKPNEHAADVGENDVSDGDDEEMGALSSSSRRSGTPTGMTNNSTRGFLHTSAYAAISHGAREGFLSDIVAQLWSYVRVTGADGIKASVEPMFKELLPGPLASLHFTKIDLGKVPIKLDNVVTHEQKDGSVQFDLDLIWVTECEISLKADYVGSFGVNAIRLKGRISFLLKPLSTQSVVSAVQYAFINPPELDLNFSGLAKITNSNFLHNTIHSILQDSLSILVLPNRMSYKLDMATGFFDMYVPPIGIARVTVLSGEGFTEEVKPMGKNDIRDVYCIVSLGGKSWTTTVIKNNHSPVWNESGDFLLSDTDQIINVHAWDEDTGYMDADDDLGESHTTVGEILLAGNTIDLGLYYKEKSSGASVKIHCEVCKLVPDLGSFQTTTGEKSLCGLLTIIVTRAFGIPLEKADSSSFVKVTYLTHSFVTKTVTDYPGVDALNPVYDVAFHVPLTTEMVSKGDSAVTFTLMNDTVTAMGSFAVTLSELSGLPDNKIKERRGIGDQGAELEYLISLCGVQTSSAPHATPAAFSQPQSAITDKASSVQKVRITVVKGEGFQIQKRRLRKADIPDVYIKVKFGSSPTVWRTTTIPNNTSPMWEESSEYILSNHGQIISLEVWDEDKGTRDPDDFLGTARIAVGKLLLAGGKMDVELTVKGAPTGSYITLRAELVGK